MRHAICYDVAEDGRRLRVARILEDYGQRVQKSVFEAELTADTLRHMMERLRPLINPKADSIIVYALCASCLKAVSVIGVDERLRPQDAIVV